jgi:hypothetical protein
LGRFAVDLPKLGKCRRCAFQPNAYPTRGREQVCFFAELEPDPCLAPGVGTPDTPGDFFKEIWNKNFMKDVDVFKGVSLILDNDFSLTETQIDDETYQVIANPIIKS